MVETLTPSPSILMSAASSVRTSRGEDSLAAVDLPENGGQGTATIAADEGPGQQQSLDQAIALNSEVTKTDQVRTDAYTVYHMQQLGMNQSGFGGFAKMVAYQRR